VKINDLIRQFSTRTILPVQVEDVAAALVAAGIADEIYYFWNIEMDTGVLKGAITHWEYPAGDGKTKRVVDIETARSLPLPEKRLVQCKELLHVLDPATFQVNTREAAFGLVQKIIIPPEFQDPFTDGHLANSDRVAILHALAVLFPFACRELLMKPLAEGKLSLQQIAEFADLPVEYAAVVMSETWPTVHQMMID
jgi:hypothetical protein